MVEFVIVLPLFVTLVFVLVQLGITFNNYLRVTDIARVSARAAAVARFHGTSACAAASAAASAAANGLPIQVSCSGQGGPGDSFSVTVRSDWSVSLPLLPWSADGVLTSRATERLE
jgi:Flp pilus assembly protein TadG